MNAEIAVRDDHIDALETELDIAKTERQFFADSYRESLAEILRLRGIIRDEITRLQINGHYPAAGRLQRRLERKTDMPQIVCPDCKGEKTVEIDNDGPNRPIFGDCETCKGTGTIAAEPQRDKPTLEGVDQRSKSTAEDLSRYSEAVKC